MSNFRAVNWLSESDRSSFDVKPNEVFVREDWWKDRVKRLRIKVHELTEIWLMKTWGLSYDEAHKIATKAEEAVMRDREIKWKE